MNIPISIPATGEDEWQVLRDPVFSGWLTQGPRVAAFEKAFAAFQQAEHAIATSNCTTGLHLILAAMGIGPGDEVIVPSFTWVATANVVLYTGATPVFADVDPDTYNIDPLDATKRVTSRTKAVIAVHLFGLCADIDALRQSMPDHIHIIEDAACAAGAAYKGRPAGTLGRAAAFSFHPRKTITTGEGGMVTTNDDRLAESINKLRNHGASLSEEQRHAGPKPYLLPEFNLLGYNYRMTDLQGAVGLVQLNKLEGFIAERSKQAEYYTRQLADISWIKTPEPPQYAAHSWQAYVTYVDPERSPFSRNTVMEKLQQAGISTRPGTHAVHTLGYYQDSFGFKAEDYPISSACQDNTMAIPLHNRMRPEEYEYVVKIIKEIK